MKRLTFDDPETQLLPVWTTDGEFVVFRSGNSLAWVRSDGSGKVERLASSNLDPQPYSFSPDGKYLAFAGRLWRRRRVAPNHAGADNLAGNGSSIYTGQY